jgi:hypothetical protein
MKKDECNMQNLGHYCNAKCMNCRYRRRRGACGRERTLQLNNTKIITKLERDSHTGRDF